MCAGEHSAMFLEKVFSARVLKQAAMLNALKSVDP